MEKLALFLAFALIAAVAVAESQKEGALVDSKPGSKKASTVSSAEGGFKFNRAPKHSFETMRFRSGAGARKGGVLGKVACHLTGLGCGSRSQKRSIRAMRRKVSDMKCIMCVYMMERMDRDLQSSPQQMMQGPAVGYGSAEETVIPGPVGYTVGDRPDIGLGNPIPGPGYASAMLLETKERIVGEGDEADKFTFSRVEGEDPIGSMRFASQRTSKGGFMKTIKKAVKGVKNFLGFGKKKTRVIRKPKKPRCPPGMPYCRQPLNVLGKNAWDRIKKRDYKNNEMKETMEAMATSLNNMILDFPPSYQMFPMNLAKKHVGQIAAEYMHDYTNNEICVDIKWCDTSQVGSNPSPVYNFRL
jgi:hypothetical protein|eukprot:g226.t1